MVYLWNKKLIPVLKRFFVLSLFAIPLFAGAQNYSESSESPAPSSSITVIPARFLLWDFNIGYAKSIDDYRTLEFRLGYVHRNNVLHEYYEGFLTSTDMHFHGPSFYFQMNKWRYSKAGARHFFGVITGYRYLWYQQESLWLGGWGGSSFAEWPVLSQWRNELLLLGTFGWRSSRFSTTEISIGIRIMQTHTHVDDTRFHPTYMTAEEYDRYRAGQINSIPNAEGITAWPLLRLTTHIGKFKW
jgi:hypothetical protein